MPASLSLSDVVAALQYGDPHERAFLDSRTGQIVRQRVAAKADETSPENRDVVPTEHCERLPELTEREELDFACRFTAEVASPEDRGRLELALAGAKAFENFETTVFRCQIANAWFPFRDRCLVQFAKDWLAARRVSYTDDVASPAE